MARALVNVIRLPDLVGVRCPWLAEQYTDDRTFARVLNGQAFCSACGATDHEQVD